MTLLTKEQMFEKISNWEMDMGEDFLDYFGSNMNEFNFMFWCFGKGYINEHQLKEFESAKSVGTEYLVGDEIFSVVNSEEDDCYNKGNIILAEFLSATATYQKRVKEFIEEITRLEFDEVLREYHRAHTKIFYIIDDEKRVYLEENTPLNMYIVTKAKWYRDDKLFK
jgi:uncharacterized protein (UPF0297 family)